MLVRISLNNSPSTNFYPTFPKWRTIGYQYHYQVVNFCNISPGFWYHSLIYLFLQQYHQCLSLPCPDLEGDVACKLTLLLNPMWNYLSHGQQRVISICDVYGRCLSLCSKRSICLFTILQHLSEKNCSQINSRYFN